MDLVKNVLQIKKFEKDNDIGDDDDLKDEIGCMQNLQMAFMGFFWVVSVPIIDHWLQLGKMQLDCIKSLFSFCMSGSAFMGYYWVVGKVG